VDTAVHRHLLGHGSERHSGKIGEAAIISTTHTSNPTNCGLWVGTDPAEGATRFLCANEPATAKSEITNQKCRHSPSVGSRRIAPTRQFGLSSEVLSEVERERVGSSTIKPSTSLKSSGTGYRT
jgi:hypothetical protein